MTKQIVIEVPDWVDEELANKLKENVDRKATGGNRKRLYRYQAV